MILAYLSTILIEAPFRRVRVPHIFTVSSGVITSSAVAGLAAVIILADGFHLSHASVTLRGTAVGDVEI